MPSRAEVQAGGDGAPIRVRHRSRWQQVARVREHYRVEDRWWTQEPIARDYFDLTLEDGLPLTVFYDRSGRQWYEQRYG
ncbi:MAG: hypothetical protein WEC75_01865 [Dehalococcoidia bacterium]